MSEARPHLRLVATAALGTLLAAALLARGDSALLSLSEPVAAAVLRTYLIGAGVMVAAVAVALWAGLWSLPTQRAPLALSPDSPAARAIKAAALACPVRVAAAGSSAGLCTAAAGALTLTEGGLPLPQVLGLLALAVTQIALWGLLAYAMTQRAMAPLLYALRAVAPTLGPWRSGAELQARMSYAVVAVVSAALVPAILLTALDRAPQSGWAAPLVLCSALAGLLGLAARVALGLGGELRRDVATLIQTTRRLSEARLDQQARLLALAPRAATAEVGGLQQSLEGLVDRARRLQVEIFLATERTIEARRAKSQHLAATSHDLRNALSPVLGFTDLLAGGYEGAVPPAAQRRLGRMRQQGQRLLRTLSEILDTAKLESQTIDLHPRECSAAEVLAQAVSEVRRLRSIEVLPLRVEIAPDLPPIAVDPIRFPQALSYLCGHVLDSLDAEAEAAAASEATAPQRPLARPPALGELLLRAYQAPGRPVLVFEVAYLPGQTPAGPVLGTAGLGLALPLARRLLALHGGSIVVIADAYPCLRANLPLPQRNR